MSDVIDTVRSADAAKDFVLADLIALTVDGPCVVFFRPRDEPSEVELDHLSGFCAQMTRCLRHLNIIFVAVTKDFDIMAAGHAELRKLGYQKIDTSITSP